MSFKQKGQAHKPKPSAVFTVLMPKLNQNEVGMKQRGRILVPLLIGRITGYKDLQEHTWADNIPLPLRGVEDLIFDFLSFLRLCRVSQLMWQERTQSHSQAPYRLVSQTWKVRRERKSAALNNKEPHWTDSTRTCRETCSRPSKHDIPAQRCFFFFSPLPESQSNL